MNGFNKLIATIKKSKGPARFKLLQKILVCDNCLRQGLEQNCTHMLHEMPHWLNRKRMDDIANIMDESEDFVREMKGLPGVGSWRPAFQPSRVEEFFARRDVELQRRPTEVFVSIDPSGGGKKSKYTIASCCYEKSFNDEDETKDRQVILAVDYEQVINVDYCYKFLAQHISRVLKDVLRITTPPFPTFHIMIEKYTGLEAMHVYNFLKKYNAKHWNYQLSFFKEQPNDITHAGEIGIHLTNEKKDAFSRMYKAKFEAGLISLHKNFKALYSPPNSMMYSTDLVREELKKELLNYGFKIERPKRSDFNEPKIFWSGKQGYGFDDKVLALIENLYFYVFFERMK
jgi:hypothetical protein